MRNGRRFLALILAASMVCTSGAVSAMAADVELISSDIFADDTEADIWLEDDDPEIVIVEEDDPENELFIEDDPEWGENAETEGTNEEADEPEEQAEASDDVITGFEEEDSHLTLPEKQEEPTEEELADDTESVIPEVEDLEEIAEGASENEYELSGEGVGVSPEAINQTIQTFATALGKFTSDTSKLTKLGTTLERFGGVTSTVSGVIAILQMTGIMKDPTAEALATILAEVKDIQEKLQGMDKKLDEITLSIINSQASAEAKDRAQQARDLLVNWSNFDHDYVQALKKAVDVYQDDINTGIRKWWTEAQHEGIWICYANYKNETSLTYSNESYTSGLPAIADNGEAILKSVSIGIPPEYMPNTAGSPFNINTYDKTFAGLITDSIVRAANDQKLQASETFYQDWSKMSDSKKQDAAAAYAQDALNTITYHLACEIMSTDAGNKWVTGVLSDYSFYCENIQSVNSGINALINVQYMTHAFEGEVKDVIMEICDAMIAEAGYYGVFALSIAGQDSLKTDDKRTEIRDLWSNTVLGLSKQKDGQLTGHDNYCYLTGTLVNFKKLTAHATMSVDSKDRRVKTGYSSTNWETLDSDGNSVDVTKIRYMGDVFALVLYEHYARQNAAGLTGTFTEFLNGNGVGVTSDFNGELVTAYKGPMTFSLSDAVSLKSRSMFGGNFKDNTIYKINSGNKASNGCFTVHDKVVCDLLDTSTGALSVNVNAAARAAYMEGHWYWKTDEADFFYDPDRVDYFLHKHTTHMYSGNTLVYDKCHDVFDTNANMYFLEMTSLPKSNLAANSALVAFDSIHIMEIQEEEEPVLPYSSADWNSYAPSSFHFYDESEALGSGLEELLENAVKTAQEAGIHVTLSDERKNELLTRMENSVFAVQEEMKANSSLITFDIFGINGNENAGLALAKAVLPGSFLDQEGIPVITAENMDTTVRFEAGVMLHFEEKNGEIRTVINPLIQTVPVLVIWDPVREEFEEFEISDEVMSSLGLSMRVRLPAASAAAQSFLDVISYDDIDELNVTDRKTAEIFGAGADSYAEITSNRVCPMELVITPLMTSINGAEIRLSRNLFTYNGLVQKPGIRTIGGKNLKAGRDYTLTWSDASSKNVGIYTVTVTGKGDYTGTAAATYRIRKARNPLTLQRKKAEKTISFTKLANKAQTVKGTEMFSAGNAKGTVSYRLVSVSRAAYKDYFGINSKTGDITVKKGLRKGSYKLKVRTVAAGDDKYNAISKVVVFRVEVR